MTDEHDSNRAERGGVLLELYEHIMSSLRPKTLPFGVKLFGSLDERPTGLVLPRHPMNVCQVTSLVRYYGWRMYATWRDMACVVGAVAVGMIEPPENMASGKIAEMLHADMDSARRFTELVPRILPGSVKAFVAAPLNGLTFEPDMVVVYGNTAQAMRLVQAYLYRRGGRMTFSTGGEYSLCADIIADTANKHDFTLAIPCFGDRKTAMAQDEELTVAFPADMAQEVLEGLRGTAKTAAYPTPIDIAFPQMPDYTLTDWAVAFRRGKTSHEGNEKPKKK